MFLVNATSFETLFERSECNGIERWDENVCDCSRGNFFIEGRANMKYMSVEDVHRMICSFNIRICIVLLPCCQVLQNHLECVIITYSGK